MNSDYLGLLLARLDVVAWERCGERENFPLAKQFIDNAHRLANWLGLREVCPFRQVFARDVNADAQVPSPVTARLKLNEARIQPWRADLTSLLC